MGILQTLILWMFIVTTQKNSANTQRTVKSSIQRLVFSSDPAYSTNFIPVKNGKKADSFLREIQRLWRRYVPELDEAPRNVARVRYGRRKVATNVTILPEYTLRRPEVDWESERKVHYTIMIQDVSIRNNMTYIHWIVSNIRNNDISTKLEDMEYAPCFAFRNCFNGMTNHGESCSGEGIIDTPGYNHRMVVEVFKQSRGRVYLSGGDRQRGCNVDVLAKRLWTFERVRRFRQENSLTLVAGNFFRVPYSPVVDKLICSYTACTGAPFPNLIKGVNDGPFCAPFSGDPNKLIKWTSQGNMFYL